MEGPEAQLARLRDAFRARGGAVVGFSGGVDSALLAAAAHDALGSRALAVTVDSPSLARRELAEAHDLAADLGVRWEAAQAHEVEDPRYAANPADRCFYCREEMGGVLWRVARREGLGTVAMGVHADDLLEDRPGHAAIRAAGIWTPLVELGAGKDAVRAMARARGLRVADKPAMACLSSRIQHGDRITPDKLRLVEEAEGWLLDRGFRVVRVRMQGAEARVEVGADEVPRLLTMEGEARSALAGLGFAAVHVDAQGYRPGGARPNARLA